MTGMRGVYLVAAELSRLGFIASPTSRSAIGADILATNQSCTIAFSVQVKTNASSFGFWLLNKKAQTMISDTHIYVLVNIRSKKEGEVIEYFIVPSKVVSENMKIGKVWCQLDIVHAKPYQDKWSCFGSPST
jgi:hypothetical protein